MPTLADLHKALDRLESEAPAAVATRRVVLNRVGSESPRPAWRHRTGPLLVAAVAILLALATVAVLGIRADVAQPAGPPPATDLTWAFDLPEPPAGTTFRRISISANSQTGLLERTDGAASLMLTVHEAGTFQPMIDLQQPQAVTVDGQTGYFGAPPGRPIESLFWPTPGDGWAQLDGFGAVTNDRSPNAGEPAQVLAEQLSVAPLVQFGSFGSPTLPFRLGWLPSGMAVQGVSSGMQGEMIDETFGSASFSDAGPVTVGVGTVLVTRVDGSRGSFADEIDDVVGAGRTALTVGGRPAVTGPASEFDARVLAVDLGDGSVFLVLVGNPAVDRYPVDVLSRIAEEADVSMSMADPSTWIPAPEAVAS